MDVRAIKTLLDISAIYTHILKEKKKKKSTMLSFKFTFNFFFGQRIKLRIWCLTPSHFNRIQKLFLGCLAFICQLLQRDFVWQ